MTTDLKHYFFAGIGGSGMSPLADIIRRQGHTVSGSDRGMDKGDSPEKFAALARSGIRLFRQDGDETISGVQPGVDFVVVSSAVEEKVIDIQNARRLNIPIIKRADLLSSLFNKARGIGIAGTSGKTTTTGMTGWMLHALGLDPTIANGGVMSNFIGHAQTILGNSISGQSALFVAEMDESDGTIALFNPAIAVLNNITLDHKPFSEIEPLFHDYLGRAREVAIVNLDDERAAKMIQVHPQTMTYGIDRPEASLYATGLQHRPDGISFTVHDRRDGSAVSCALQVPGRHNVSNALAALAVAVALGQDLEKAVRALESFRGIKRRLEVLGTAGGVTVIDDFGHNPDKIAATLDALRVHSGRLLVMFQPHGFAPMKLMRNEIIDTFAKGLRRTDKLVMPEIYYVPNSDFKRTISSAELISEIRARGIDASYCTNSNAGTAQEIQDSREKAGAWLLSQARKGDRIVIMGARDDTLTEFAMGLLERLGRNQKPGEVPKSVPV